MIFNPGDIVEVVLPESHRNANEWNGAQFKVISVFPETSHIKATILRLPLRGIPIVPGMDALNVLGCNITWTIPDFLVLKSRVEKEKYLSPFTGKPT